VTVAAPPTPEIARALRRYRVGAWIVGVGLLVLVLVGMPLKYLAGDPTVVAIVGPVHGRAVLVALAGTIPFVSFVAERKVTRPLRDVA
jgi:hypothetical protein